MVAPLSSNHSSPGHPLLLQLLVYPLVVSLELLQLLHQLLLLPQQAGQLTLQLRHLAAVLSLIAQLGQVFLKLVDTKSFLISHSFTY